MIVGQNIINHLGALVIYIFIIPSKLIVFEKDAKKPNVSIPRNYLNNIQGLYENIC
jgi:rRNA pseudouridine-1189 N-methylase Emg1 (Nep1/Mra1 family)